MTGARTSGPDRIRQLMMAALDGEIDADDRRALDEGLTRDPDARAEWDRLRRVKEMTRHMTLRNPPDEIWGQYWTSVYRRIERGVSWVLISIGAIVLLSYGGWRAIGGLVAADLPWFLKGAVVALLVGLVVLLVSVAREKLFAHRRNPYKDVSK